MIWMSIDRRIIDTISLNVEIIQAPWANVKMDDDVDRSLGLGVIAPH